MAHEESEVRTSNEKNIHKHTRHGSEQSITHAHHTDTDADADADTHTHTQPPNTMKQSNQPALVSLEEWAAGLLRG